jgi:hypothetical protein
MDDLAGDGSRGQRLATLAVVLIAYLLFALFLAWVQEHSDYETEYLGLGSLAVRGEVGLYQDDLTGQWVPLPFYFYGLSQLLAGPNLLVARLASVALGAVVVVLIFVIATRWGGPLAGAVAGALFSTHGLVLGYFSVVDFSGLVAVLHLAGLYVLFCTGWRGRDLIAMAVWSILFLVKPNYWASIPFMWTFLVWRGGSLRRGVALTVVMLAVPAVFFTSDRTHLKLLAYVPVLRDWVSALGYYPWHTLIEDMERLGSDYATVSWGTSYRDQLVGIPSAVGLYLKRYAVWLVALASLVSLAAWRARRNPAVAPRLLEPAGLRFAFVLYWYLLATQFVVLGPLRKHAFAYMGAVAPLLTIAIGCVFARMWERLPPSTFGRRAVVAALVIALAVSPWIHRHHNLPRLISLSPAPIPALQRTAERLAALIPAGETRVFSLADPLPIYLAGRRTYLRQFHQYKFVFTSLRDPARTRRSGLWGPVDMEEWLGSDARYAVIQSTAVDFYRARQGYAEILTEMDSLLARNFILLETFEENGEGTLSVYRRRGIMSAR